MSEGAKDHLVAAPISGKKSALLINAPARNYTGSSARHSGERELTPYGLGLIASAAEREMPGEVGLLDAELKGLAAEEIAEIIDTSTIAEVGGTIGINVFTPNFGTTMILAGELRNRFPKMRFVFGGPHATLDPESILEHVPNSTVIQGEGKTAFTQIAKGIPPEEITGAIFKDRQGKVVRGGTGLPSIVDLSQAPRLERAFVINEPYEKWGLRTMTVLGSRGCRGSCSFCITPTQYEIMKIGGAKKVRFRRFEDVIGEIKHLKRIYGIQLVQFLDDDFLPNEQRARLFLKAWEQASFPPDFQFIALLRPDKIPAFNKCGLLKALRETGLRRISLGIETGHDTGRRMVSNLEGRIDPKYDEKNVIEAIRALAAQDIETSGFFMIGFPEETRAQIQQTLDFIGRLKGEGLTAAKIFVVKVYPYTGLWNEAIRLGFTPEQLGHYRTPDVTDLIKKGCDPKDISRDVFVPAAQLSEIPPEELNKLAQKAINDFARLS